MSVKGYNSDASQVPAASSENMKATSSQIGTRLTQPRSPAVHPELTRIRGMVRREPEGVRKEQLSLLTAQIENRVPAPYIARQIEILERRVAIQGDER